MTMFLRSILCLLSLLAGPGLAAPIPPDAQAFDAGIIVDQRDGVAQVYDIDGDRLGMVGLRWAEEDDWLSASIFDGLASQTVIGLYAGPGLAALDATIEEFTDISDGYRLQDVGGGRVWGAVWVLWEGAGNNVFTSTRPNGRRGTATLTGSVSLPGNPLSGSSAAAVPLPLPVWLLLSGLGGLMVAGRLQGRGRRALISGSGPD
ncbi:MAG: hypothetical protein AAGE03_13465 [Pseudomonadota bacterium]